MFISWPPVAQGRKDLWTTAATLPFPELRTGCFLTWSNRPKDRAVREATRRGNTSCEHKGHSSLTKRAVVQFLLALERFFTRLEGLEMAAAVQYIDAVDIVARHPQLGQID